MKAINFVFLILLFFSCSPIYYAPNAHNVPIFTEKNQGNFSGGIVNYGFSEPTGDLGGTGLVAQTAFSFSNHFAVQGNCMFSAGLSSNVNYFDGALGYYKPINDELVFEIYTGVGGGYTYSIFDYDNILFKDSLITRVNSNYLKFYAQPSIGFHKGSFFASLDTRIGVLSFNNVRYDTTDSLQIANIYLDALYKSHTLIEPAISLGINAPHVQFKWQIHFNSVIGKEVLPIYTLGTSFIVGILLNRKFME